MQKQYPYFLKTTVILLGLVLLNYILFNLKDILVPLAFALMLAILLNPMVNFLERKKMKKVIAIFLALIAAVVVIAGIGYFLSMEMGGFADQWPVLKKKFGELTSKMQQAADSKLGIDYKKQNQYLSEAEAGLKPLVGSTIGTVLGTLSIVFLLPVYAFLFMYYKTLLVNFIYEIFAEKNTKEVELVLTQTKGAIQSYMFGLVLEALVVAILNSAALFALGVKYAILLGLVGALLNVLPYIGGIIAIALPVLIVTITKDGFNTQLGVIGAYLIIQFIDNHFLVPYLVSSKVKINALVSIVIVLLGGALWGVSGMFLSIPFIGVLKIIFDRIPELKPWGKLLGDEQPTRHKGQIWKRKKAQVVINAS